MQHALTKLQIAKILKAQTARLEVARMNRPLPRSTADDGSNGMNIVAINLPGGAPANANAVNGGTPGNTDAAQHHHQQRSRNEERIAPVSTVADPVEASLADPADPPSSTAKASSTSSSSPAKDKDTPTTFTCRSTACSRTAETTSTIGRVEVPPVATTRTEEPQPSSSSSSPPSRQDELSQHKEEEEDVEDTTAAAAAAAANEDNSISCSDATCTTSSQDDQGEEDGANVNDNGNGIESDVDDPCMRSCELQQEGDEGVGRLQQEAPPRPVSQHTNSSGRDRHHLAMAWDIVAGVAEDDTSDDDDDNNDDDDDDESMPAYHAPR